MAEDLKDTIRENAAGPKQASADGVSTQQHPLGAPYHCPNACGDEP